MISLRMVRSLAAVAVLAVLAAPVAVAGTGTQETWTAGPLDDGDLAALARDAAAVLNPPAGTPVAIDAGQSFRLAGPAGRSVRMAAARYDRGPVGAAGTGTAWAGYTCALVLAPGDASGDGGEAYGVVTIGVDWTEMLSCDALAAVGLRPVAGRAMPDVLLAYRTRSPNAAGSTPVVLTWDAAAERYRVDVETSRVLGDLPGTQTIAGMRQALRRADRQER